MLTNQPHIILVCLSLAAPIVVLFSRKAKSSVHLLDLSMFLLAAYECLSLPLATYPPNAAPAVAIILTSSLLYLVLRMLPLSARLIGAAVVSLSGILIACSTLRNLSSTYSDLQANGFTDLVAFRYRLIRGNWILGEWLTLLLLTLPFALVAATYFRERWNRKTAALLSAPAALIATPLILSCSRAVFGAIVVLVLALFILAAAYRILAPRPALIGATTSLGVIALILLVGNTVYPGLLAAYATQQASQIRSIEGRLTIWKRSASILAEHPLVGVGSGNAPLFLAARAGPEEDIGFASRTFSLPLQVLTENGALGAAIYLTVLVLAVRQAHLGLRHPRVCAESKAIICCMAAGGMAVIFRELTYSSLLEHAATAMLFAATLAFLVQEEAV